MVVFRKGTGPGKQKEQEKTKESKGKASKRMGKENASEMNETCQRKEN